MPAKWHFCPCDGFLAYIERDTQRDGKIERHEDMATETQRHRDKKYRDRESPKSVFFLLCSKVFCLFMLKSTIRVHPVSKN